MHGSRLTCMTFYLKALFWQNGSQWVSIECASSHDISCSEENVYKQIFGQCAFTKLWVSNSGKDGYRSKTFSEFREKGNVCSVCTCNEMKVGHLTSVTLTRCYLRAGNSFVPETDFSVSRAETESWLHHDDSGKVTTDIRDTPGPALRWQLWIMRIIMAVLIVWHSLDIENNRQYANN